MPSIVALSIVEQRRPGWSAASAAVPAHGARRRGCPAARVLPAQALRPDSVPVRLDPVAGSDLRLALPAALKAPAAACPMPMAQAAYCPATMPTMPRAKQARIRIEIDCA